MRGSIFTVAAIAVLSACSDASGIGDDHILANIALTFASSQINVGQTTQANVVLTDGSNLPITLPADSIKWSSSSTSLATVNATGLVTALAPGSVTITASARDKSISAPLTITAVAVASVAVTVPSGSIAIGQTIAATAVVKDANGTVLTDRQVSWSTSNTATATVSSNGSITGIAAGAVTITATSESKSGTAAITVTPAAVASVVLTVPSTTIAVGQTMDATVVLKDAAGNVLTNRAVAWSTSSSATATVSAGGSITGVAAGPVSITATSETKSATTALTVTPPPTTSITSLSRDAGSAAGGAVVKISGAGFGAADVVKFGSATATGVSLLDASTLQVTVPPNAVGKVGVSVTHSGVTSTLANAFEYLPARTTTYFSSNFENNTLSPFFSDADAVGTLSLSTDVALSGTHSAKGTRGTTTGGAGLAFSFSSPPNPATTETNGVYMRWYIYIPTSTVDAVQQRGGQIKILLFRTLAGSGTPGYLMCGVGSSFSSRNLVCFVDNGILTIPGGDTGISLEKGFVEMETWYSRAPGTGAGTARLWVNGKHIFTYSHANMGSDVATEPYFVRFGLVFSDQMLAPVSVYLDDVVGANGFIDP